MSHDAAAARCSAVILDRSALLSTANLRTKIIDFRGFDSSVVLIFRGGISRPIGNFPESLSQAILVVIILVGRLGIGLRGLTSSRTSPLASGWSRVLMFCQRLYMYPCFFIHVSDAMFVSRCPLPFVHPYPHPHIHIRCSKSISARPIGFSCANGSRDLRNQL